MRISNALTCIAAMVFFGCASGGEPAAKPVKKNLILSVAPSRDDSDDHSAWRYFETWQTDVCKTDAGEVVRVDGCEPRQMQTVQAPEWVTYPSNIWRDNKDCKYRLKPTTQIQGSPWPLDGWQKNAFDDGNWTVFRCNPDTNPFWLLSGNWIMRYEYRSLALICLRGKFDVQDPARVSDLSLTVNFQGGAIVYLNGKEVGRASLPEGNVTGETLALDYPKETFVRGDGFLMTSVSPPYECLNIDKMAESQPVKLDKPALEDVKERLKKRSRTLTVSIPPALLQKGPNVLAVEIHRAPASEDMFLRNVAPANYAPLEGFRATGWWNRVAVESLSLTTTAGVDAISPNVQRSKGVHVSNCPASVNVVPLFYSDPNESLKPLHLAGLKNGSYAGQLVVSSSEPIKGLKAVVTDLKGAKGTIPASAVEVSYAQYNWFGRYDNLEPSVPAEIPFVDCWRKKYAVQPIWFTVKIPRDAASGEYTGKISISAGGLNEPVETLLSVNVIGNWTLPKSQDFTTYVGLQQAPDALSLQYNVPMWSDAHWKLLERDFELLGQLGNKDVFIPLVSQTYMGNERTMAYWIKQPDGSYKVDFSNVEKYLDLAVKHWGKVPNVCVIANYGWGGWNMTGGKPRPQTFTVKDPASGELSEAPAPLWGTPEALAFWKPVLEQFSAILAKRGLEKSLTIYQTQFCDGKAEGWKDLKKLLPDLKFTGKSHYDYGAPAGAKWHYMALMAGSGVYWNPDEDMPVYGWREPLYILASGRGGGQFKDFGGYTSNQSLLSHYRFLPEKTLLSGVQGHNAVVKQSFAKRGFAAWGADFWPVLKDEKGNATKLLVLRYSNEGSTSMEQTVYSIIAPGKDGPIATCRMQMLREGLQEAEARVFVQDALLDHADKLGTDLAKRCKEICDERTRVLRYCSEYHNDYALIPQAREELSLKLFQLAGDVAEALGKESVSSR